MDGGRDIILLFYEEAWGLVFSTHQRVVGVSIVAPLPPLVCLQQSRGCQGAAAVRALHDTLEAAAAARTLTGSTLVVASDVPGLAEAAAWLLGSEEISLAWAFLHLDLPATAGNGAAKRAALLVAQGAGIRRAGLSYSLSRAVCSLADELMYPAPSNALLMPHSEFLERTSSPCQEYVVNGDNWLAQGAHALYPAASSQRSVEEALAQNDGLQAQQVLCVGGGIASAFELVCQAFALQGREALLVGPAYGGIEKALLLFGVRPHLLPCGGDGRRSAESVLAAMTLRTHLVVLTHPALFTCADRGDVAQQLAGMLPSGCVFVVDECYSPYLPRGAGRVEALAKRTNGPVVIGLRGLSKLQGLAALRLAYVVSSPRVVRRLRAASPVKELAGPVLAAALEGLQGFNREEALKREAAAREALQSRLACECGVHAQGAGPYVVVTLSMLTFDRACALLKARHIHVNVQTRPLLVYQPVGGRWDRLFCATLRAALAYGDSAASSELESGGGGTLTGGE